MGVCYYDMGDTASARKVYTKALALRPAYTMALNNTGVIFFNQKKYSQALTFFTKILQTDTTFADAFGNIGAVYHNTGNYKMAAEYYEKALSKNIFQRNAQGAKTNLTNMAIVYKTLGDTLKSRNCSERAAAIH